MAREYLDNFYQNNRFATGTLRFLDTDLALADRLPICAVATETDHIAPGGRRLPGSARLKDQKPIFWVVAAILPAS